MRQNIITVLIIVAVFLFFSSIRIIRLTNKGLVERPGKYNRFAQQCFQLKIPVI
jgi:regulator of protease activity HflC (stomatin/prohibitin superfamily)